MWILRLLTLLLLRQMLLMGNKHGDKLFHSWPNILKMLRSVAGSSEKDIVTLGFQGHVPPIQRVVLEVFPQLRPPHRLPLLWAVFFQKLLRYLPNPILLIRVKEMIQCLWNQKATLLERVVARTKENFRRPQLISCEFPAQKSKRRCH
ncbi:hypothetical protein HanRHA438_Chr15g0703621 [Helianthus annuus]|uniref:Secreted protein n=1 Tax=Helianthus annuus TaxID=4232 RepID=A0A9K3H354_HELAN|nr:hypothetical protein HanXRQr2_Chr15g0691211 [Helianthus annuus]KAJ0451051.1 hypothetical protein HanHA300_Chr15g0563181 [Helianthus annuus]KAJ0455429.1 hypothetical protein HanIR_Chr15g0751101 [Helianthus annuus]KAJ0472912.1 hypothetical protein HanHA89_Chr15g0612401 [Helianthus annuus]KAJ0648519.1 hypothetical protein HanLR1_Chr15g0573821 [Helianthus annuus]